ncbi:MAG: ribonuclease P protein component [Parachlamydiales bacterium]|nr:ribonuclease P protein component [Parachlamydiales bacterium]
MVKKLLEEEEKSAEKDLVLKKFSFSKSFRILKKSEFFSIYKAKNRLSGDYIQLNFQFLKNQKNPKLGLTVSKKFGCACIRNNFKRRVKEAFRLNKEQFRKNISINVSPKFKKNEMTFKNIENDLLCLLKKIS